MEVKLEKIVTDSEQTAEPCYQDSRMSMESTDPWPIPDWDPSYLKELISARKNNPPSSKDVTPEQPEQPLDHNAYATNPGFIKFRSEAANTALAKDIYYSAVGDRVKPSEQHVKERDRLANYFCHTNDPCLRRAQASLARAGYAIEKTGRGFLTVAAITTFQQAVGLLCTGMLDQETVKALEIITKAGLRREDIEAIGRKNGNLPK